jgi:hypothetical protein
MKSPNRERYGVDRSAHIQVHRYSWGGKASLRPEKKEARRKFRRRCQRLIHLIKKNPKADAHFDQRPVYTWSQLD